MIPKPPKDWKFYSKYVGLALLTLAIVNHVYQGFNYLTQSFYILGVSLFIAGLIK